MLALWAFSNKIKRDELDELDELEPGDHIYSWRFARLYAHHGIYIGDGQVIHYTTASSNSFSSCPSKLRNPCQTCGYQKGSHGVVISCLDCFLSGGNLNLFRYSVSLLSFFASKPGTRTLAPSDPCNEVLHRAKYLLRHNGFGIYNALRNNCEDFAIYCKTGLIVKASSSTGISGQASSVAVNAAALQPILLVVTCGLMVFIGRYLYDIGVRRDTIKISVENLVAKNAH